MDKHPLAYMLMLCDELQCWDRTAYGQNSRRELHPMWCEFEFDGDQIRALYQFDPQLEWKKAEAKGTYPKMQGKKPKFVTDIEEIVALNGRYKYGTLDYSSLGGEDIHKNLEKDFDALSLEYKLSNILQAKAFAQYLDAISCFYTDRPVAYEKLEKFTEAHMDLIGLMEHDRWMAEKRSMGWEYGTAYLDAPGPERIRELTRTHSLMLSDYKDLSKEEQDKDTEPMNCMLRLIEEYDGLRIYRV